MRRNQVTFCGRVGTDPRVTVTQSGKTVANFRMAVSSYQKGDYVTMWFGVEAWGKLAERIGSRLGKGDEVTVMGSLKQESWEDKNSGETRTQLVVNADEVIMPANTGAIDNKAGADGDIPF